MNAVALRHLAEITLGKMLQPRPVRGNEVELEYLRAAHVQPDGRLTTASSQTMWFTPAESRKLSLRAGDVVVVEGGAVGRSAYISHDLEGWAFQNSIVRLRPRAGSADGRYLNYAIQDAKYRGIIDAESSSSTIPHFTAEKVARLRVPAYHADDQRLIADFLDRETVEIDAFIAEQKDLAALLEERWLSQLNTRMLSINGPRVPLRRVATLITGRTPTAEAAFGDEGIPWVTPEHLDDSGVGVSRARQLRDTVEHELPVTPGPVSLLCCIGATIGKVGWSNSEVSTNQQLTAVSYPKAPRFMFYALKAARPTILANATGTTIPLINNLRLGALRVPDLPSGEAVRVAEELDREHHDSRLAIEDATFAVKLAQERRAALVSAAVTGKIDVTA